LLLLALAFLGPAVSRLLEPFQRYIQPTLLHIQKHQRIDPVSAFDLDLAPFVAFDRL